MSSAVAPKHRPLGQSLFSAYVHAPASYVSFFSAPPDSAFAGMLIADPVDKVEWGQHSVVRPAGVRAFGAPGAGSYSCRISWSRAIHNEGDGV